MIKFRKCPFAISSAQLPASHDRHLYLFRYLRSLGLYVAAFGTFLIVACGQREEPVPEVRGQTMTKQVQMANQGRQYLKDLGVQTQRQAAAAVAIGRKLIKLPSGEN